MFLKTSTIRKLDVYFINGRINENDLFKHDWRTRSQTQVLQYVFLKWLLAFLVGLLTGVIATLINLAVENIAGYKLLAVVKYIEKERYFFFQIIILSRTIQLQHAYVGPWWMQIYDGIFPHGWG